MRATLIIVVATMCMLPVLQIFTPASAFENITYEVYWFGNGMKSALVDFQSSNVDDAWNLSVQTGMYVDEAELNISTVARAGQHRLPDQPHVH